MIKHIVMWKLIESEDKEKNIIKMKSLIEGLLGKIHGIVKLEVATSPISSTEPLDMVLYSEFESFEDLNAYTVHPEHLKVVEFVKSVCATRSVVDYKV